MNGITPATALWYASRATGVVALLMLTAVMILGIVVNRRAVVVTSLLRPYPGRAPWRAVHWLAYVLWPVALAHSIGSGADLRHGALLGFALGCAVAVAVALTWRLVAAARALPRAQRAGALLPGRPGRVSFRGGS